MKRKVTRTVALALLLGAGAAQASIPLGGTVREPLAIEVQDAQLKLKQAFTDIGNDDYAKAAPELDALIAAPGFAGLDEGIRFSAVNAAAAIAYQAGQYAKAHALAVDATRFNQASPATWTIRLASAMYTGDNLDAGRCLQTIAQRWPERLDDVRPQAVGQIHHALRTAHQDASDRGMLEALFDAGWQSGQSDHDWLWRDLALMHIERGEVARAVAVAQRIRTASTALSMRVDKRFDAITRARLQAFNVDHLLDAQITDARAQIKAHPDQLDAIQRLQDLLIQKGQNPEVLAISDAAVAHAEHGDGPKAYADFASHYNWVLNQRSLAMAHQGRWEDAVLEMTRAARRPEDGGVNVSQSINLAGLYTDMGQPDKAAAAILEPGEMSPYGRMQLEYVRLQIAIEKNDARAVTEHMAYLRQHRDDDIATWQRALLRHGDLDDAAALLIERLKSPDWRNQALVEVQHYIHGAQSPAMKAQAERLEHVVSRPDVQATLAQVGRIESFQVLAPDY